MQADCARARTALNLENDTDRNNAKKETVIPNELILGRETGKK